MEAVACQEDIRKGGFGSCEGFDITDKEASTIAIRQVREYVCQLCVDELGDLWVEPLVDEQMRRGHSRVRRP